MSVPAGDYRSPEIRRHFVYRAFDGAGVLLYVGCTLNPTMRANEHRGQSEWYRKAKSFKMTGPFNYDTARRLEREAIRTESPLWNCDEPKRVRVRAMHRRISKRWYEIYLDGDTSPDNWHQAVKRSQRKATCLVPLGRHKAGVYVSSADVTAAEAADRRDFHELMKGAAA